MAHKTIKFEGFYDLQKAIEKNIDMEDVKKVVKHYGSVLQDKAMQNADFKGHYEWKKGVGRVKVPPTGNLKGKIGLEIKDGGMTAEVEPAAEYSAYVELGTRFMDAQPYMKPAFDEVKRDFTNALEKLVR